MIIKRLFSCAKIVLAVACMVAGMKLSTVNAEARVVNPHWTGKHCLECHSDKTGESLKYSNDVVKTCNRCHRKGRATTDVHPVNKRPDREMKKKIPKEWKLQQGEINCLTCHDVMGQMQKNHELQQANHSFIRGAPYSRLSDFCFFCHDRNRFKKVNPHNQIDEDGEIQPRVCLYCHQAVPDQGSAAGMDDVSFVNKRADTCLDCHSNMKEGHPARSNHIVHVDPDRIEKISKRADELGVYMPFLDGSIFCSTCHNPHQKGVVKRIKAAAGAGDKEHLRLSGDGQLCIVCHSEMMPDGNIQVKPMPVEAVEKPRNTVSVHAPWKDNMCKKCHRVTTEERGKPDAFSLCFRPGCHKETMLSNEFEHERSITENCYFCHLVHTSNFEHLLRADENKLCLTCHPLVGKGQKGINRVDLSVKEHTLLVSYAIGVGVPGEQCCAFCHKQEQHVSKMQTMDSATCTGCHSYVSRMLSSKTGEGPVDIHDKFKKRKCSECHDAHSGQYRYQLKQPVKTYLE